MSEPETQPDKHWVPVARLLRPQGRRGELLAEPLTDLPDIFVQGRIFRMTSSATPAAPNTSISLEDSWRPQGKNAGRLVLKLAGVDSISAAETLQGRDLSILESDLPALESDTFLVRDLVGCTVFDGERSLGTVLELEFPIAADGRTRLPDAADLLVVQPHDRGDAEGDVLVPFVKAWLVSVDLVAKRIVMNLPPGLFDDAPEA